MIFGTFGGIRLRYAVLGGALLFTAGQQAFANNTKKPQPVVQPAKPVVQPVQPRLAPPEAATVHITAPRNTSAPPSHDHDRDHDKKVDKGGDKSKHDSHNGQRGDANSNSGTSTGPAQFAGIWSNVDQHPQGVASVQVTANPDGSASVEVYQACRPTACDWGSVPAQVQDDGSLTATYAYDTYERQVTISPADNGEMQYQVTAHFTDNSGRPDHVSTGTLAQQQ